jgi:hypothetical protein
VSSSVTVAGTGHVHEMVVQPVRRSRRASFTRTLPAS